MRKKKKVQAAFSLHPDEELHIGAWIAALGKTQTEVAADAGIGEAYLSQLISGEKENPGYQMIVRISRALGILPRYLTQPPPNADAINAMSGLPPALISRLKTSTSH